MKLREEPVVIGVPQGSVLGPVPSILLIKEMETVVCSLNTGSFPDYKDFYADCFGC